MVLHEIYGLSAADIAFCRRLRAYGFTIYAPILVGTAGHAETIGYKAQCTTKVCVSREFAAFELNKSSPVCDSLRILGRSIYSEHGAPGFGVIGLCLTGNFALAMMADETLVAPVVAEPSLPFDWTPSGRRSLHLSDDEITCIKRRVRSGTKILGYRFAADGVSPPERFARMREEFGEGFEGHEILSTSKGHHSVFTEHYDDSAPSTRGALDRLVSFLRERLSTDG
jgi:dienelactone hydrolase